MFVNLRTHSHFTLGLAVGSPLDFLKEARNLGHFGFAITDQSTAGGLLPALNVARKEGFPVALGVNFYFTMNPRVKNSQNRYDKLMVFASNEAGYRNLCKLISLASLPDRKYFHARLGWDDLVGHKDGLIVSSSCYQSPIGKALISSEISGEEMFLKFKNEFKENFVAELVLDSVKNKWSNETKAYYPDDIDEQADVNAAIYKLAKKHNVHSYISSPAFLPNKKMFPAQKVVISNASFGKSGWTMEQPMALLAELEMQERAAKLLPFLSESEIKDLISGSIDVFNRCKNIELKFEPSLPAIQYSTNRVNESKELEEMMINLIKDTKDSHFDFYRIAKTSDDDVALRTLLKVILRNRKVDLSCNRVLSRLALELEVIQRNGMIRLADYFLLIEDVGTYLKSIGRLSGPGRGSGAGSLVVYALDITDVNPFENGLLFERFLQKDRIGKMNFS